MHHLAIRRASHALAFLPIALFVAQETARADVESPRVVLGPGANDLVVGPGMNAAGRDLRGCEFVTQDLTGAVFDGCNLYGVRISGCILKGASFRNAVFSGGDIEIVLDDRADFTDATINGNWRSGAEGFDHYGPELYPRQLMSTWSYRNRDLHQCAILGSSAIALGKPAALDFRKADLREATFRGDCSKCDFSDARIFGAYFGNDSITFDQLASTRDFKHRRLRVRLFSSGSADASSVGKWNLSHINLTGSDLWFPLSAADFTDATVNDCTMRNGLTVSQLCSTRSYHLGDLTGLRLMRSDLSGCDFSGMNLSGCGFSHCKFAGASFEDAVITGSRFVTDDSVAESDQLTADQIRSTWNYKHGHMDGIRLPDAVAAAVAQESRPPRDADAP